MSELDNIAARVASGQATVADMDRLGADVVNQIKSAPDLLQVRVRGNAEISQNEEQRQISYLVSDETVDRMGDIIKVAGWDLKSYKQNPVVLWSHDGSRVPPIGRSANVRRRYGPSRLTSDIEFAPKEAHEFADTIYQLAKRGFIRATSVGFLPHETAEVDDKQREKMGLGKYGSLYTRSELMEISVVAVPANPSALQDGVKSLITEGRFDEQLATRFFDTYNTNEEDLLKKARAVCRSFVDFGAIQKTPVEIEEPEATLEEKSPACRQEGETIEECVERKIPELIEQDGMDEDQAVAVANSVCEISCDEKASPPEADQSPEHETAFLRGMASLIEQQAEQTLALRQLVDSLTDLTRQVHAMNDSGERSGSVTEPEAATPEAVEMSKSELDKLLDGRLRGFAEGLRRDLNHSSNNNWNSNV
tara:strand:- start:3021 stop:4283 length:1263 start_codon:yes stop_codon:yes gene_type:complete